MAQGNAHDLFPVFFGVWVALGILSLFFFLNKDAALKRKVWPAFTIATGILFIGFLWAMGASSPLFVIAVVIITVLNLRAAKFCDACGKTLMMRNPLSPPQYCAKCGAKLTQ